MVLIPMNYMRCFAASAAVMVAMTCALEAQFVQKPYLQLGDHPRLASPEVLDLLWLTADRDEPWGVEVRNTDETAWRRTETPVCRKIEIRDFERHRVCIAQLTGLQPGGDFAYRVLENEKEVFLSSARSRRPANQFYQFVVVGDIAKGSIGQRAVAYQIARKNPDFVAVAGDIVYERGRASEYFRKFFPVYNADSASATAGAPLIRSTLFVAAVGNHDVSPFIPGELDRLAYFYYWDQPLNGPMHALDDPNVPHPPPDPNDRKAFLEGAGPAYPAMDSFSFDYGNAHWIVLDSNKEVDWTSPALRDWIISDLKSSKAAWRFALCHHPPFDSTARHARDVWPRNMLDALQRGGVDILFTGHVHNYQRNRPVKWNARTSTAKIDRKYDGVRHTKPHGILNIVTGGGGATLESAEQDDKPATWEPFTVRYMSREHSFTLVDVRDKKLTITQIGQDGTELDRFVVTK